MTSPLRHPGPRLHRARPRRARREAALRPRRGDLREGRRGRRLRRDRPAVRRREVRRVDLHLRQQHQHHRGRHPPLRLLLRPHRHGEQLRPRQQAPQGERGEPRRRGHPRGHRLRHLRQGPPTPSSRARPRPSSATPRIFYCF